MAEDWIRRAKAAMKEAADEITNLRTSLEDLRSTLKDTETELDKTEAQNEILREKYEQPEWGNCRRGCPPAYLNQRGFCSPQCENGGKRG